MSTPSRVPRTTDDKLLVLYDELTYHHHHALHHAHGHVHVHDNDHDHCNSRGRSRSRGDWRDRRIHQRHQCSCAQEDIENKKRVVRLGGGGGACSGVSHCRNVLAACFCSKKKVAGTWFKHRIEIAVRVIA
jgi:hypothetical protein